MNIYSYRGDHERLPENTMIAFRQALLNGAEGIALDVQMTRDRQPIVFRDESLGRATDAIGLVRHHDLGEIQSAEFNEPYTKFNEHIPSLAEYLDWAALLPHKTILMMNHGNFLYSNFEENIMACLAEAKGRDRLILASSQLSSLRLLHTRYPDIALAWIPQSSPVEAWEQLRDIEVKRILAPLTQTTKELVETCAEQEITIMVQGVSTAEQILRLKELGVENIMVTDMATARAALKETKMPYSADQLKYATEKPTEEEEKTPMQMLAQRAKTLTYGRGKQKGKSNIFAIAISMALCVAVATILAALFMNLLKGLFH